MFEGVEHIVFPFFVMAGFLFFLGLVGLIKPSIFFPLARYTIKLNKARAKFIPKPLNKIYFFAEYDETSNESLKKVVKFYAISTLLSVPVFILTGVVVSLLA